MPKTGVKCHALFAAISRFYILYIYTYIRGGGGGGAVQYSKRVMRGIKKYPSFYVVLKNVNLPL
jgi:hypothetical protein